MSTYASSFNRSSENNTDGVAYNPYAQGDGWREPDAEPRAETQAVARGAQIGENYRCQADGWYDMPAAPKLTGR